MNESVSLDDKEIKVYQSLIGTLQWAVSLGRIYLPKSVMTMSGFRVEPREGHMERVKRMLSYLA